MLVFDHYLYFSKQMELEGLNETKLDPDPRIGKHFSTSYSKTFA